MATDRQIQSAFLNSIRSITDGVKYSALRDALRVGDYFAALNAIDVDDAAFDPLRVALTQTYAEGGVNAVTGQKWPVPVRWNSATPQAETYARRLNYGFTGTDSLGRMYNQAGRFWIERVGAAQATVGYRKGADMISQDKSASASVAGPWSA